MNSKKKGDIGVGRAIQAFAEKGWTVAIPLTDSQDYDLIVDIPQTGLRRVQVKYSSFQPRPGTYQVQLGVRGGVKGGIWKKPNQIYFDDLFIAAKDGTNWLIPRSVVKSSIDVGRNTKNASYEFMGGEIRQDGSCG